MRGLIWERECNSDSSVTADGALERSIAFMAHVYVGENTLGNSAEQICWPSLWYESGVFVDCSFSLAPHTLVKMSSLQYLAEHRRGLICLARRPAARQVCSLSISKKTAITGLVFWEVWRERLACSSWRYPCLGHCHCQFCRDLQWGVILSKWIKLEKVSRSPSATWLLAAEKRPSHRKPWLCCTTPSMSRHIFLSYWQWNLAEMKIIEFFLIQFWHF